MKLIHLIAIIPFILIHTITLAKVNGVYKDSLECVEDCEAQLKEIKRYARNGSPHAQTLLALAYKTGELGITPDEDMAWKWLKRAKFQKFPPAQYYISHWYRDGFAGEKDLERANKYLKRSAEQGFNAAEFEYALVLMNNNQLDESIEFLNKAYDAKYPPAIKFVDTLLPSQKKVENSQDTVIDRDETLIAEQSPRDKHRGYNNPYDKDNKLLVYGSKEDPFFLMTRMIAGIEDMRVYEQRGRTGSRVGDQKCGDPLSRCIVVQDDGFALQTMLEKIGRSR